jgi:hypothetical protein
MPRPILLLAAAILVAPILIAPILIIGVESALAQSNTIASLRFLGAATIPNDAQVNGTLVGGLSGLDYNPATGQWAIVSDDKSEKAPARFYLAQIDLAAGTPKISLERAVILQQADGAPYPGGTAPDPESIRFDASGAALWWSSEGDRKVGLSPLARKTGLNGKFISARDVHGGQGPGSRPATQFGS